MPGLGIVGGALQGLGQLGAQALSNKMQREENRKARAYNLKMWNLENEYNTPTAQMQRLEDAGLNPNLMYGQGSTGNAGSVANAGSANLNEINMPNVAGLLRDYVDYQTQKEELFMRRYQTGIAKNDFIKGAIENDLEYGELVPYVFPHGQGRFNWNTAGVGKKSRAENKKDLAIGLSDALKRIREAEAGMSESLKGWNLTAGDQWYTRLLAKFMEDTSFDKMRRK